MRADPDFDGENEDAARAHYGAAGVQRRGAWGVVDLRAVSGVCRCRRQRSIAGVWEYALAGHREIGAGRWLYWDFYGRLHGKRRWDFRSACVRLPGQLDFPA